MTENRREKIQEILTNLGEPKFRLGQIEQAIYKTGVLRYSDISNLPQKLRETLEDKLGTISSLKVDNVIKDDETTKVLFKTKEGFPLETVATPDFICISSQSGCAMGCQFCSTGKLGFNVSLTSDEIIDQVLYFKNLGLKLKHVSFMGMGEPLLNYDNVAEAIRVLTDPKAIGLSHRKVSLSTVGIVPGIKRLTQNFPTINLAWSLHSPFEEEREALMPASKAYSIRDVLNALDEHAAATNRQIWLEYVLLKGVNDDERHAEALVKIVKSRPLPHLFFVNLIKFHAGNKEIPFEAPASQTVKAFQRVLEEAGLAISLRGSAGEEFFGACGQLGATINKK